MKNLAMAAAAIALCAACAEKTSEPAAEADAAVGEAGQAPAAEALSSPIAESWDEKLASQVGETMTIEGEFYGADPEANCAYASTTRIRPAKTNWDWLIRKGGRCVVVTRGGDPRAYNRILGAPDEILDRANVGRKVKVTARVEADDTGRVYLAFVEGRPLDE